ncbi:MAG: hypothetical protein L6R42_001642 [Xanthoria sp. 1 TBL-2021]|nr:MAG: hypothetical protein L6R42_001642 [Xanthoria sp. 1 TBL-2021]
MLLRSPHLDAILSLGPALCQSIQHLESGDSDTGRGNKITDQAVTKLAAALPNLLRVSLSGATRLSDKSLLVFFTHCPDLRHISIGGNDRVSGSVKGPALNALREQPNLSKKPDTLRLANQPEYNQKFNTAIKKVSAARKKLAIQVGCTGRGGLGVNTYIAGKMKDGHQALGGPGGFSRRMVEMWQADPQF